MRDLTALQDDLDRYTGAPRRVRATEQEPFDTTAGGDAFVKHPGPGGVLWCDDAGVTYRRWNWRQAKRTQLTEGTTAALFILDALEPLKGDALPTAAGDLVGHLRRFGLDVRVAQRMVGQQ